MRVLTLLDSPSDQGGAERFAMALAAHLPRERFEAWLCATRSATPAAAAELAAAGVPLVSLGRVGKLDVHRLVGLATLLRRERFDVIHAHMFGSNAWGSVLGRLSGVPVVIAHEHNWSFAGEPVRRLVDRHLIARLATRFVTVSQSSREQMIALEHIPERKIVVLPTAHVEHASALAAHDVRAELGVSPGAPIVAVAASLRPEKALEVLVSAHARLLARAPGAHLVLAGDGPCREALARQVERLGLAGSVHLLGERHDVGAILAAADVGVLSSDWEGMPLFALECMAAGIPLVATAVGGLPELLEHGRSGWLVPPRDPGALAAAIGALLADPARRRELASAGAERVRAFSIGAVVARFCALYEDLLALSRRR